MDFLESIQDFLGECNNYIFRASKLGIKLNKTGLFSDFLCIFAFVSNCDDPFPFLCLIMCFDTDKSKRVNSCLKESNENPRGILPS